MEAKMDYVLIITNPADGTTHHVTISARDDTEAQSLAKDAWLDKASWLDGGPPSSPYWCDAARCRDVVLTRVVVECPVDDWIAEYDTAADAAVYSAVEAAERAELARLKALYE